MWKKKNSYYFFKNSEQPKETGTSKFPHTHTQKKKKRSTKGKSRMGIDKS